MQTFDWTCPFCNRHATITENSIHYSSTDFTITNSVGSRRLDATFIVCPSPTCKKFTLSLILKNLDWIRGDVYVEGNQVRQWDLIPPSRAQVIPDYVPQAIRDDYYEACLIVQLSSKASATLSRRCLQGILRDYWGVKPRRLLDEIEEIKDKVDPLTWDAIEAVRTVGNIGAHMEKDINVIIDVDSCEAELLIELIETLIRDWYIAREERKVRLSQITELAQTKEAERKGGSRPTS